jgi:hypothetical protein
MCARELRICIPSLAQLREGRYVWLMAPSLALKPTESEDELWAAVSSDPNYFAAARKAFAQRAILFSLSGAVGSGIQRDPAFTQAWPSITAVRQSVVLLLQTIALFGKIPLHDVPEKYQGQNASLV